MFDLTLLAARYIFISWAAGSMHMHGRTVGRMVMELIRLVTAAASA